MKKDKMELLFGELMGKSVCDVELWKKLFAEYDAVMDEKRKEQYLRVLRGTFDPESRRLLFVTWYQTYIQMRRPIYRA